MVDVLCTLLACPIPDWIVIILAVIAMILTGSWGIRYHRSSALLVSAACLNFVLAYLYIRLQEPSLLQRAAILRLALIYLLLTIIIFAARYNPRLVAAGRWIKHKVGGNNDSGAID